MENKGKPDLFDPSKTQFCELMKKRPLQEMKMLRAVEEDVCLKKNKSLETSFPEPAQFSGDVRLGSEPEIKTGLSDKMIKQIFNGLGSLLIVPQDQKIPVTDLVKEPSKTIKVRETGGFKPVKPRELVDQKKTVIEEQPNKPTLERGISQDKPDYQQKAISDDSTSKNIVNSIEEVRKAREENFLKLRTLLGEHFKGENPNPINMNLSQAEFQILVSIIKRKYKCGIDLCSDNINSKENKIKMMNVLIKLKRRKSTKRPEENYKFIFKRCIKYLQDNLKKKFLKKPKKREFDKIFHELYFKDIANEKGLTIEHFYHPRNSKKRFSNTPKTINNEYINNISHNEKFVNEFKSYMKEKLFEDYCKTIDNKIESLTRKWIEQLEKSDNCQKTLKEIISYIEKNNKCKLPWSHNEVREAIDFTYMLFSEDK